MLIGDVARRSGVSARMLRHYEALGLVRPTGRTPGGYREYSGADIRRIFHIESLRSLGLSLRDVGRALDDPGFTPSELVADLIRQTRERIARETELLAQLGRVDAAEPAAWEDVLHVVALLRALASESAGERQRAALTLGEDAAVPVEALVDAVLSEADPIVAGALRWALAQGGEGALPLLARGLASARAEVRGRAVRTIAAMPGAAATPLLKDALADPDLAVRGCAAVALGARGAAESVPTLLDMVVGAVNDVDAADALSALAGDPSLLDRIARGLTERLADSRVDPSARRRLTQALADVPGPTTSAALAELSRDEDPGVALTARYLLGLRASG